MAFAGPSQFSGPLNTLGNVSTQQTVLSATVNPAAGEYVVKQSYRWGYLSTAGLGAELGELDDLEDDLDKLIEELDRLEAEADDITEIVTLGEVEAVRLQFEDFLLELGEKGALQFAFQARPPAFPIAIRSDAVNGVLTLDAYGTAGVGVQFIDSPLEIIPPDIFAGETDFRLSTDTVIDLTTAFISSFSLGYSHDLANSLFSGKKSGLFSNHGDRLLVGVELNIYHATMSSQLAAIDQEDENEDLGEVISDEYDNNQVDSSDFGVDLGVLWISDNFHLGATWENINEPSFDSSRLGVNCSTITNPSARRNCEIAAELGAGGRVDLRPEYIMESQISVEAALTTSNKHFSVAGSFDLNSVHGPLKDEYQWATASVSYFSDSMWIPMARAGFRTNLSGSELSYVSGGFTLLGGVHLDATIALDMIEVDGEDLPRAFALNLGVERQF